MDPLGVSQVGLSASSSEQTSPLQQQQEQQQQQHQEGAPPATPAKDWESPLNAAEQQPAWSPRASQHYQQQQQQQQQQHHNYQQQQQEAPRMPESANAWATPLPGDTRPAMRMPAAPLPSPWANAASSSASGMSTPASPAGPATPYKEPRSPFSEDGQRVRCSPQSQGHAQSQSRQRHASLQGHEAAEALLERDRKHGYVRIRILGVDRAKKDFYVKLEAASNLSIYHHSHVSAFSRSLAEFHALHGALAANHPHLVLPALPLPATSAASEEEEDKLLRIAFQKWADRITRQFDLARDEELRNFIEADFSYHPVTIKRRLKPSSSSFAKLPLSRSRAQQEDDLSLIKVDMTKLEGQYADTAKAIDKDARNRKYFSAALNDLSEQLAAFATTESYAPLNNGFRKLGDGLHRVSDTQSAFGTAECVTLADALMYSASESREAKDALVQRQLIVDEQRSAAKQALTKQRALEKMRNSSSINHERVGEALEEYEDAHRHEHNLTQRLNAVSTKLQPSVIDHAKHMHEDLFSALLVHSKAGLAYERHSMRDLEALRREIKNIPAKRSEDVYYVHQPPQSATTSQGPPHSAASGSSFAGLPPSSHTGSGSPQIHSPQPHRSPSLHSSVMGSPGGRHPSAGGSYGSPPLPPHSPSAQAQSMFAPPTHRPHSSQNTGSRINDLAKSVVVVPGSPDAPSSLGGQAGGGSRRPMGGDQRTRLDAKMAASKLSTMFNN